MRDLYHYAIFFLAFVGILAGCSQMNEAQKIDEILREVSAINTIADLKEVTLDAEDFLAHQPDNGAELIGYFENSSIRKVSLWVGISNGFETKDYYFEDNQLIFVHEQFNSFVYDTERDEFDVNRTEKTFIGRYYFKNEKLLNYETTGHNRFEDDTIDPGISLRTEAQEYVSLLSSNH